MVQAVVEIVVLLVQMLYGRLKSRDYISHYEDKAVIKRWHV